MAEDDSTRYHRVRLGLSIARGALGAAFLIVMLATGAAHRVAETAAALTSHAAGQVALVAATLAVAHTLLMLPLSWISGWVMPRRYGLLHQPLRGWLADRAKAAALGAALGLAAVEAIYALLSATPLWWLAAAALAIAFAVVLTAVVPIWVLPLFYRLTPLADESLRARLLALAERSGLRAIGVWVTDQSRRSRVANAAVVGLGRTRRILLYDTLATGFGPAEIEAVLAHELGHHAHGDIRRGLLMHGALGVVTFWVADRLLHAGVQWWTLRDMADPAGLPWLALVLAGLSLLTTPLVNAFSRRLERQADDFALALTRDPEGFVSAMERLAVLNLAERKPHPLKEALLFSHPALDRRIARARAFA